MEEVALDSLHTEATARQPLENMNIGYLVVSTLFSGIIGIYFGLSIHELTHYSVGKLRGANANIITGQFHMPNKVIFENPRGLSQNTIRIATGLVMIYPVLAIMFLIFIGLPESGIESIVLFTLMGASGVSPSDLLGMLYPERWQEYAVNYSGEGHRDTLRILFQQIR